MLPCLVERVRLGMTRETIAPDAKSSRAAWHQFRRLRDRSGRSWLMEATEALAAVADHLAHAGYQIQNTTIGGRDVLVARRSDFRWRWLATRLHTFVVVFTVSELDESLAEELSAAAQQHAIKHKGGLPRGQQTGTATVAVFLSEPDQSSVRRWFSRRPKHRFAALRFPVLVELDSATVTYFRGRLRAGFVYSSHLRAVVQSIIVSTVPPPPPPGAVAEACEV